MSRANTAAPGAGYRRKTIIVLGTTGIAMKKQKPIVLDRSEIRKSVRKPMPKPAQRHQDKREKLREKDRLKEGQ